MMDRVNLYTYTTVKGPGKRSGAYTYILEYITGKGPATLTKTGMLEDVTENQTHLKILREALERIQKPCEIEIYTDSKYLQQGAKEWLPRWQRAGWVNAKGKPVANREEWEQVAELLGRHLVSFQVGVGHSYRGWLQTETEKREREENERNAKRDRGKV